MRRAALGLVAGAVLLGALASCGDALFLAPPGSTIGLTANPPFIASDGAVSVITAFVVEPAGTPVADGTIVLFFTNLGNVEPQGKTHNGIAKVNFTSDSRSGTAHVTANSAGGGPVSTPGSPSASPTPPPSGGGGAATASVDITIGNVNVAAVVGLRADPPRITTSNSTHVFARVIDANGNGIANVPVFFNVVVDPASEQFDVTGPLFTNNNGEVEDVLRTKRTVTGGVNAQVTASAVGPGKLVTSDPLQIAIFP